ncbi:M3 family metallopeptidase [Campylobacter sp. RM16190]|uniref:M3 family metallopeptidase n=1 Tax=Campylobacter sp. RM16190 TaxID=1705727 RepID=UPI001475BE46|nr:M3 family metallopeptidase [Campylobacter sp. RM16190]
MEAQTLPQWSFDDAYVDFEHENFTGSLKRAKDVLNKASNLLKSGKFSAKELAALYEEGFDKLSSLKAFCRCKMSENTKDERVAVVEAKIQSRISKLELIKQAMLAKFEELSEDEWEKFGLSHWKFYYEEQKNSWSKNLKNKEIFAELEQSSFTPIYAIFTHLNNLIDIKAQDSFGEVKNYSFAKCGGILKGSPDSVFRENIFNELSKHYEKHAPIYVDALNMLHGFRQAKFKQAKCDILLPSFEQNKISHDVINAMHSALQKRVSKIREAVTLRAPYLGKERMSACDLLAPSPFSTKAQIPYHQAISTIKSALSEVSEEISGFIDLMLKNRWIEASTRENKAAGAFYTRFNELKQARIFSSYMGTQAHMIQQAHELGHAWHYWIMRDMPSIKTEFPMSLAEIASTFNEAVLREYIKKNADENLLFDILWQELKSAANFMLHISVRYSFETDFIKARSKGLVTPQEAKEMMKNAWQKWYADSTQDMEEFLPYFKLHFYKTDQYIYNYPYTVGYLLSQFLIEKFRAKEPNFFEIYKAFLRDTGSMSVDDIIKKHFGKDIKKSEFWLECIDGALGYVEEFKAISKKRSQNLE